MAEAMPASAKYPGYVTETVPKDGKEKSKVFNIPINGAASLYNIMK